MTDLFLVTDINYPTTFKAFELVSHDCGRQAGHKNYGVPLKWLAKLNLIEFNLAKLLKTADSDFECFCIGDEDERNKITKDYHLTGADKLLQEFFEEFQ